MFTILTDGEAEIVVVIIDIPIASFCPHTIQMGDDFSAFSRIHTKDIVFLHDAYPGRVLEKEEVPPLLIFLHVKLSKKPRIIQTPNRIPPIVTVDPIKERFTRARQDPGGIALALNASDSGACRDALAQQLFDLS
jgi:hypothetical protein